MLILSETREQVVTSAAATTTAEEKRPDTPASPSAKRPRLFNHFVKPQRTQRQPVEKTIAELPTTPPGLTSQPVLSPRQSTPRTPAASPVPIVIIASPRQVEPVEQPEPVIETVAIPMEQETARQSSPSVISKNIGLASIELFDFPIIPIECKFHFQTFNLRASAESITAHREFLEKKTAQQEKEVEQLLKQFDKELHSTVVGYVKNSIEPLIDSLKQSNQKRIDNLVLDQMREKALRTIKAKCSKDSLEQIGKAQDRFERTLQLKLQLDKLDKRFNENMPLPPSTPWIS